MSYSIIDKCPITGHDEKIKYFDLGNIPLVNNLFTTREESLTAPRYPLSVNYFPASGESALECSIDAELLFSYYVFRSEVNKPYYKHCQEMFRYVQEYIKLEDNDKILDIGGNDGTLLDAFRSVSDKNLDVLNLDPSKNLCEISLSKNIPVYNAFFSYDVAKQLKTKFKLITSTNVFQHLKDINSFTQGIERLLDSESIWILEFPYWIHDMKTNQFDQIYHEHMYYHSITPLKMLMEKHGLKIVNITKQNIHGGTLRLVIAKKQSKFKPDITVEAYIQLERNYGLDYHINWGKQVQEHNAKCFKLLTEIKNSNKVIFGFGAAAKGCIFLNSMGLDYNDIPFIIDDTDLKQGKFVPGNGIEIVSREFLKENQPDYILILAHNFTDYIIESLKDIYNGKFIVLLPEIKIYE
jgi:ubiquinone/menaquinone biosynthesis C-methylase UbiE